MDWNKVLKVELTEMDSDERWEFFESYINKARIVDLLTQAPARAFRPDSNMLAEREIGELLRNGCTVAQLNKCAEQWYG